jgi:molybdenum cofactor synthesis domain-containing protein
MRITGLSIAPEKDKPNEIREELQLTRLGIDGDHHMGVGLRPVSLMDSADVTACSLLLGAADEPSVHKANFAIEGLNGGKRNVLDRLRIGKAELEITKITPNFGSDAPIELPKQGYITCDRGLYARVARGGAVHTGDKVEFVPKTMKVLVISLSDRASRGEFVDRSGPRLRELTERFFSARPWPFQVHFLLLPDDRDALEEALAEARDTGFDAVFSTGSTGLGPRDIAPEVIRDHADRIIPGIMEHIRLKYGAEKPLALLSRTVAALMGRCLVFALPGNPQAVDEYCLEIFKTLEHLLLVVHGIDPH